MAQTDNMYAYTRQLIAERFSYALTGNSEALLLVVHDASLGAAGAEALRKTAASLGWADYLAFLSIVAPGPAQTAFSKADLFEAIEGLDPVALVLVGEQTRQLAEEAYAIDIVPQGSQRLFGRSAAVFRNLDELLSTDKGKQDAWNILKTLPHAPR